MYISVLGIDIESYGHILDPPRVSFDSKKNNFFPFFKPFLNGLIEKKLNVKKIWYRVCFGVDGLVFKLRSPPLPQDPLFPCFGWLYRPVWHYFAKNATKHQKNVKLWQFAQSQKIEKVKNQLKIDGMSRQWVPHVMRPSSKCDGNLRLWL